MPASFVLTSAQVSHLRRAALTYAHSDATQSLHHVVQSITAHHLVLQAQEETASVLSLWVRLPQALQKVASKDQLSQQALTGENKHLVRMWGNRCTLQLAKRDDWPAISAAVRERVRSTCESRIRKHGEQAVQFLSEAETHFARRLRGGNAFNSADVHDFISQSIPATMVAHQDIIFSLKNSIPVLITVDGRGERIIIDGNRRRTIVPRRYGEWNTVSELNGLVQCASRYFDAYGPATEQDFRYWMGVKAAISKSAVKACLDSGEIQVVETDNGEMMLHRRRLVEIEQLQKESNRVQRRVWLLGRFDALLLAHKDKTWLVDECERRSVWNFHSDVAPTVLLDGWIRGTWRRDGSKLIRVTLFEGPGGCSVDENVLSEICSIGRKILSQFWEVNGSVVVEVGSREVWRTDQEVLSSEDNESDSFRRPKRARRR